MSSSWRVHYQRFYCTVKHARDENAFLEGLVPIIASKWATLGWREMCTSQSIIAWRTASLFDSRSSGWPSRASMTGSAMRRLMLWVPPKNAKFLLTAGNHTFHVFACMQQCCSCCSRHCSGRTAWLVGRCSPWAEPLTQQCQTQISSTSSLQAGDWTGQVCALRKCETPIAIVLSGFIRLACKTHRFSLLESCWRHRPEDRPSFAQIAEFLVDYIGTESMPT